ncbi:DEAD/DEAH box helicase [Desulfovibrio ferrophilus]|nr:DEAD/DEAH box helicase [Desulfovibrio ferrophilus]
MEFTFEEVPEETPVAVEPAAERASYTQQFAETRPDEVMEPDNALPEMTLEQLPERLREACVHAGWDKLMPVQALSMPYLMARRDLMIQSRTGSGKTGSFLLPILDRVDTSLAQCQALVLVPTRELAQQVAREAQLLTGDAGMRVASVYGGTGYGPQLDALREGAHLVVGTPGRVLDHLLRRSLTLDDIQILVFDEADRMLSIGFYQDMKQVQSYMPGRKVNMFMTSATYPPHVMRLAGDFMDNPQLLSLSHSNVHIAETPHSYYEVKPMEKDRALVRIIEMENPTSAFIFCNTKQNVHYITAVLQRFGYDADELSGDLAQNKREHVLNRIRQGNLRFLVVTDVAARGIDIPDLSHVFLYEPPEDHEVYIHRAGRTGRAGASGEVISLVDVMEKFALERIGKMYKINFDKRELPTDEDVQGIITERMTALLEARLRGLDNVQRERLVRTVGLAKILGESEDGLALIAMLLDDIYQGTLTTAPVTPPSPAPARTTPPRTERSSGQDRERDGSAKRSRGRRRPGKPAARGDQPRQRREQSDDQGSRQNTRRQPAQAKQPVQGKQPAQDKSAAPEGEDKPKPKRRRRRRPRRRGPRPDGGGGDSGANGNSIPPIKDVNGNK